MKNILGAKENIDNARKEKGLDEIFSDDDN
jgi:hypothetical protein